MLFILQLAHTTCSLCVSWKLSNIAKYANFSNNDVSEMEFGSFDGRDDGEYNGVGLVQM